MIEKIILAHLVTNERYTRKVVPYILKEYFQDRVFQVIFELISEYVVKYNSLPSREALSIDLLDKDITDEEKDSAEHLILSLVTDDKTSIEWVTDETEKFCKDSALYLALTKSLSIINNKEGRQAEAAIPDIMTKALAVSFDSHIGHDYFLDAEKRYEYYHQTLDRVPFEIDILNRVTDGGLPKKTLTILMAGVHVGKTALMCNLAASNVRVGKKVLYITLEMSEEMISQRIDANIMDLAVQDVKQLDKTKFMNNVEALRKLYGGDLKVKEYPTKQAGSGNFRFLLNELKIKSNFVPDIIYIDYMNICIASTLRQGKSGLYEYVKTISEEIRGLAVEFNLPIVTATQFNREGFQSSDPGMEDVSESFGTNATADLILAIVRSEEMDREGELMIIQLKNRLSDAALEQKRFVLGVDLRKMKFFDVEANKQTLLNENNLPKEPFMTAELEAKLTKHQRFDDFFKE